MVDDAEQKLVKQVRDSLSPPERQQLDRERLAYEQQYAERGFYSRKPEITPKMKEFQEKVAKAAEQFSY